MSIRLQDLKDGGYNPRKITATQLARLKKSLDEFGDLSGIIYNRQTGHIIGGHQRLKVLPPDAEILLSDLPIPSRTGTVALGEVKIADETFTYREVDWPLDREKMANLAANKHAGEWDKEKLSDLLEELSTLPDFDLDLIGFENAELEALLDTVIEDDFDADKEYDNIVEPRTLLGDIYQLGPHRLICGSSSTTADVEVLMDKKKARLVFTDPPYNIDYTSQRSQSNESNKFENGKIKNDNLPDEECLQFFIDVLSNLFTFTTDDATIYWWFAMRNHHLNVAAFEDTKWYLSQVVMWLKNSMVFSRGQEYHRLYEPCIVGWKKGKTHYRNKNIVNYKDVFNLDYDDFAELPDVWYEKRDSTSSYVHPTQKPVRLAERALKKNSEPGDIVIDLFGGSGSTLIACDQMGRSARLMELDPKYCDVIVTRYVKHTGNNAILLNGKKVKWAL